MGKRGVNSCQKSKEFKINFWNFQEKHWNFRVESLHTKKIRSVLENFYKKGEISEFYKSKIWEKKTNWNFKIISEIFQKNLEVLDLKK